MSGQQCPEMRQPAGPIFIPGSVATAATDRYNDTKLLWFLVTNRTGIEAANSVNLCWASTPQ
jgi:hypothetical protein